MNRAEALESVRASVLSAVPGADVTGVTPDQNLREAFELDSLDFLGFVEALGERTGCSVAEDDYAGLATLSDWADLLVARTG
ncbi:MAG TPA: acyl carrier protein [Streptomyces sp.]|nr:acyl carrier protein [Streptomyces sp.]